MINGKFATYFHRHLNDFSDPEHKLQCKNMYIYRFRMQKFHIYNRNFLNSRFIAQELENIQIRIGKFGNFHSNQLSCKNLEIYNPYKKIWKFPNLCHKNLEIYRERIQKVGSLKSTEEYLEICRFIMEIFGS